MILQASHAIHLHNAARTMTLEQVIAKCPRGARLFSLQKGQYTEQLKYLPADVKVEDWTEDLTDWAETAAFVDCLDLVVTIDTGVSHLAGALGRPVKLLLGEHVEWRWKPDLERGRSRWYSSVELVRITDHATTENVPHLRVV